MDTPRTSRNIRMLLVLLSTMVLLRSDISDLLHIAFPHVPAAYEPIQTVVVTWPVDYSAYWSTYAALVAELAGRVNVGIIVPDASTERAVDDYIANQRGELARDITFWHIAVNTIWIRDYGPFYRISNDPVSPVALLDARYAPLNRPPLQRDDSVPHALSVIQGYPLEQLDLVLEGGNLLSDGLGTCFTSVTILSRNRNIGADTIREMLRHQLGCQQLIILPVLVGEETGHVDLMIKVVDVNRLMVADCDNEHDRNCVILDEIADRLSSARNTLGDFYKIIRVPIVLVDIFGRSRRYVSFVNSLTVNDSVLVPAFGLPEDDRAMRMYQAAMPEHTIVPVDTSIFRYSGGTLHCITNTIPVIPRQFPTLRHYCITLQMLNRKVLPDSFKLGKATFLGM